VRARARARARARVRAKNYTKHITLNKEARNEERLNPTAQQPNSLTA